MPRGKFVNHKGRSRHFTSPEELQKQSDESSSEEEEDQPGGSSGKARGARPKNAAPAGKMPTSSEESEEDSGDDPGAKKGVAGLIEIQNPNRAVKKVVHDVSELSLGEEKPELSRRDREQLRKQKARERYAKLHAEGKTAQAKADLARLALVRQQREDAAAKREAELKKKAAEDKKDTGKE